MLQLGLTSNIMSLGGIAIAIGAMVDAAIIMVENDKSLEHFRHEHGRDPDGRAARSCPDPRGRPNSVGCRGFFSAGHHSELHPRFFAGSAGGTASSGPWRLRRPFLCSLPRCWGVTVPVLNGSANPVDYPRDQEPDQPFPYLGLPAVRGFRASVPTVHARCGAAYPLGNVFPL